MKRHLDYFYPLNCSPSSDEMREVFRGRKHSSFSRPRKALLSRPSEENNRPSDLKENNYDSRGSILRNNYSKKFPKHDHLYENFSNHNDLRECSINLSNRSDNVNKHENHIDPLLAVAAAAAGLQKSKSSNSVHFSSPVRGNSNSAATVAAVAAAMNAAAMAAALGAGNMFSSKQLSDLGKVMSSVGSTIPKHLINNHLPSTSNRTNRKSLGLKHTFSDTHNRPAAHSHKIKKVVSLHHNRFPHHLDHRDPEDDSSATRTLFVGNLTPDITVDELKELFERYGLIEDIDIKRRDPESGITAYAFIRYVNLDMAHRAKLDMSGQPISQFICKIGYGKVVPTQCLWIGGLGPWITYPAFATLLEKLGPERIIWPSGKNYANVLFPSVEMAIVAANILRGYPLGGGDRRIRVDFTNEAHMVNDPLLNRGKTNSAQRFYKVSSIRPNNEVRSSVLYNYSNTDSHPKRKREHHLEESFSTAKKKESIYRIHQTSHTALPSKKSRVHASSYESESSIKSSRSQSRFSTSQFCPTIETATHVKQLSMCLSIALDANFFLKSSSFPCRMHLLRGDTSLVNQFMGSGVSYAKSTDNVNQHLSSSTEIYHDESFQSTKSRCKDISLRITQRMRLDPLKLDDISQRIEASGKTGFCILLAVPSQMVSSSESQKQPSRPLRNLVAYLRTKDSAGVVLNPIQPFENKSRSPGLADSNPVTSMLHALPPCDFAFNLLKESAMALQKDYTNDDHLVVLLIRNTLSIL